MQTKIVTFGVVVGLLALAGCGGGGGARASVEIGTMPPGGTFTGVWFSPQYGEMHMRQTGTQVIGEYTKDERRGTIQGTVQGNVMRFEWRERRELVPGRPSETRGRGYWRFVVGQDGRNNLLGEWGPGTDEIGGGPWNAYMLRNRRPRLSTDASTSGGEDSGGETGGETGGDTGGGGGGGGDDLGGGADDL